MAKGFEMKKDRGGRVEKEKQLARSPSLQISGWGGGGGIS